MKKHLHNLIKFVIIAIFVATPIAPFINVSTASAATGDCFFRDGTGPANYDIRGGRCSVPGTGSYGATDVLTGRSSSGAGKAIPNGINNKTEFINFIIRKFNNGNRQDTIGSAFIIQEMRSSTDQSWPSNEDITQWQELMKQDDVRFDRRQRFVGRTSFYDPNKHNTFYAPHTSVRRDVITITQNGRQIAQIESECGNMVAGAVAIAPPEWDLVANSDPDPPVARPGQTVAFNHTVRNNGPDDMVDQLTMRVRWSPAAAEAPARQNNTQIRNCDLASGLDSGDARRCNTSFTIPNSAITGQKYCQFIRYGRDNRRAGATSDGAKACVVVHKIDQRCTVTFDPVEPEEGNNVTVTMRVIPNTGGTALVPPHRFNYTFTGQPPANATPSTSSHSFTVNNMSTGIYTLNGTYTGSTALGPNTAVETCNGSVTVQAKPYFSVMGGDLIAGGGGFKYSYRPSAGAPFVAGTTAFNSNPSAGGSTGGLWAFNRGSGDNFKGAGSQLAALVYGAIEQFTTTNFQGAPSQPLKLAFANEPATDWGGNFDNAWEVSDYWGPVDRGAVTTFCANTLGGQQVIVGQSRTCYVNGNLIINNHMDYPGGWASVNDIPNFRVIVRGNIYIQPNVERLDGTFIALPTVTASGGINPNSGRIYTCANGASVPSAAFISANCRNKLVFNGAVIAKQIKLLRVKDTSSKSVPCRSAGMTEADCKPGTSMAAEVFNYSPDVWLAKPAPTSGGSKKFESITSLPPVL